MSWTASDSAAPDVEFPVPGAIPAFPPLDAGETNPHVTPRRTVSSITWLGWGVVLGMVGGALVVVGFAVVSAARGETAETVMAIATYGAIVGAIFGCVYGVVVGLLEMVANRFAAGKDLATARLIHGGVGAAPLVLVVFIKSAGPMLLFAALPAAFGAIAGALLAGRYQRLKAEGIADPLAGGGRVEYAAHEQHRT
jgi:hypothetical protein